MSLPGRWRWCDRPGFCDARKAQNALHTLIHQRLTPSCGGLAPTAERTMDPARIFTESLTPRPELENSQGHDQSFGDVGSMFGLAQSGRGWTVYEYIRCSSMSGAPASPCLSGRVQVACPFTAAAGPGCAAF